MSDDQKTTTVGVPTKVSAPPAMRPRPARVFLRPSANTTGEKDLELQRLLQQRLRFTAFLVAGIYLYFVLVWATRSPAYAFGTFAAGDWFFFAVNHLTLLAAAAAAVVLYRRGDVPLGRLRLLEIAILGLPLLHQCGYQYWSIVTEHAFRAYLAADANPQETARAQVLPWFVLIIGYGVFIPNTWKRCLAYVGAMAVAALAISVAGAAMDKVLLEPLVVRHHAETVLWLAFALVFAIYNSYRIECIQTETIIARRLGQYRLIRRLGAGGMGEVHLAEHALLQRPCALKLIHPAKVSNPEALARFEREVQTTATLTHPNTIQIYDYGHAEDGTFYYVMEYLPGLSLEELVKRHGLLPPGRAVHILRQVASALQEAHSVGLIHRDIKPSNVILCERGGLGDVAKLLDFGLVLQQNVDKPDSKVTMAGMVVGTPAYISPEQAAGQGQVDARSDIYSFGATAYFLLTGQPPFKRDSAMEILAAHLLQPLPPLASVRADVPSDLAAVIECCMEKDPAKRPQTAAEVEFALGQCACARDWGPAQAAAWWRQRATGKAGSE